METLTPDRFKAIRRARGLTQQQLGDELELKQPTIAGFESGRQPIDRRTAYAMRAIEAGLKLDTPAGKRPAAA